MGFLYTEVEGQAHDFPPVVRMKASVRCMRVSILFSSAAPTVVAEGFPLIFRIASSLLHIRSCEVPQIYCARFRSDTGFSHLLCGHLRVYTPLYHFDIFEGVDAGYTPSQVSVKTWGKKKKPALLCQLDSTAVQISYSIKQEISERVRTRMAGMSKGKNGCRVRLMEVPLWASLSSPPLAERQTDLG